MIDGHRVVGFIPFGRKRTVAVMVPYLVRAHLEGELDEVMLCLNFERTSLTQPGFFHHQQAEDLAYAHELEAHHPGLFRVVNIPGPDTPELLGQVPGEWMDGYRNPKQLNTGRIYWYCQDRNAVYLRFDDDIIWLHRHAIRNLVRAKLSKPEALAVFPTIWNNAISSWTLQQRGILDTRMGRVAALAVDRLGWGHAPFAEYVHQTLLESIESGDDGDRFVDENYWHALGWRQQFSVSCFAVSGNEYADVNGVLTWDEEEHWLTMHRTGEIGKSNFVYGGAHVAHWTFFTQQSYLNKTDLLYRYWQASEKVTQALPEQWRWR
jgi:hypothetical protein